MDGIVVEAARAFAVNDVLGVLNRIALRDDAPSLALRGLAMARLGQLQQARVLLNQAKSKYGTEDTLASARCELATAEISLVQRDIDLQDGFLNAAREQFVRHSDSRNLAFTRIILARWNLLLGRLDECEASIEAINPTELDGSLAVIFLLTAAALAARRINAGRAAHFLRNAQTAAEALGHSGAIAEVKDAREAFDRPVALATTRQITTHLGYIELEALVKSQSLVVDTCRRRVFRGGWSLSFATRPVLLGLLSALGQAYPNECSRVSLTAELFNSASVDESSRVRLRMEISRLRREIADVATIEATRDGFRLVLSQSADLVILRPVSPDRSSHLLAIMADGQEWSSASLARAFGTSVRTIQRSLGDLARDGHVHSIGKGITTKWVSSPLVSFPTTLLLPETWMLS